MALLHKKDINLPRSIHMCKGEKGLETPVKTGESVLKWRPPRHFVPGALGKKIRENATHKLAESLIIERLNTLVYRRLS